MTEISAQMVKELRGRSGAGMMECKKALAEAAGDIEKAQTLLRARGKQIAAKKADRETREGSIFTYIHTNNKIGVMVELGCETDFVARNEKFQELGRDIAMQIAAMSPRYVKREQVDQSVIERELAVYKSEAMKEGKPENVAEKVAQGRVNKFYSEIVLTEQAFVKEDKKTIGNLVEELIAKIGEKVEIRRFQRFQVGETKNAS